MPKQEGGGEHPKDEAFDYGKLPEPTEADTQPMKGVPTPEETAKKSQDVLLQEGIGKAETIKEVLEVLHECDYFRIEQKIIDVLDDASRLLQEKPGISKETIAGVLENSAIFQDETYQTKYPDLNEKIRRLLIENLKEKFLK